MVKLFFSVFIAVLISFTSSITLSASDAKTSGQINCDIQHSACVMHLSGCTVTFDIHPKPVKAMADLTFKVSLSEEHTGSEPYIDLGMPGMDMGPNRVILKASGDGSYEGKGIIVRCPSGRTVWCAKVTIPGKGVAEFIFDVVY
jgi:hypothetical protein